MAIVPYADHVPVDDRDLACSLGGRYDHAVTIA